jgi:iron complex outermembrane receptor protein
MFKLSFRTSLLAIAVAATSLPAYAQVDTQQSGEANASGDIIVTAQRRAERLIDVPISVLSQSDEELKDAGVTNMRDLTRVVPGLTFTTNTVFAQPALRGIQTTLSQAGSDSPIAIYLDGVYQPNQMFNSFDLPDIERVEVLKGPQGTLFGRNATGGAISIHTKQPSFATTGYIEATAGLFTGGSARTSSEFATKAYFSGPIVEDLIAVSLSGYYDNIDGYLTDDITGDRAGRIENQSGRIKILITPDADLKFTLTGAIGKLRDNGRGAIVPLNGVTAGALYPGAVVPTRPWHTASENRGSNAPVEVSTKAVSMNAEWTVSGLGTISSLTSYSHINSQLISDVDGSFSPNCQAVFACILFSLDYGPNKTFQQELNLTSEKFGAVSFVAGAFYYTDKHALGSDINPPLTGGIPSGPGLFFADSVIRTKAGAVFGEVNVDISDRLHVIGGLRYSVERKRGSGSILGGLLGGPNLSFGNAPKDSSATPRFSIRYSFSDDANIYATYSKGFKSSVLDSVSLTNDVANPERLDSFEVGVKYRNRGASLNVAAFYYNYDNLQVQFFNGARTLLGNASSAKIYGLEFDGSIMLTDELKVSSAASWIPSAKYGSFPGGVDFALPLTAGGLQQVVVDLTDDRLLKTPRFTGNIGLAYSKQLRAGTVEANFNAYTSSSFNWTPLRRIQTKAYTQFNAQIGFRPANSGFGVSVWGKNLGNKAVIQGATPSSNADGVTYGAPRQIGITVDYRF